MIAGRSGQRCGQLVLIAAAASDDGKAAREPGDSRRGAEHDASPTELGAHAAKTRMPRTEVSVRLTPVRPRRTGERRMKLKNVFFVRDHIGAAPNGVYAERS